LPAPFRCFQIRIFITLAQISARFFRGTLRRLAYARIIAYRYKIHCIFQYFGILGLFVNINIFPLEIIFKVLRIIAQNLNIGKLIRLSVTQHCGYDIIGIRCEGIDRYTQYHTPDFCIRNYPVAQLNRSRARDKLIMHRPVYILFAKFVRRRFYRSAHKRCFRKGVYLVERQPTLNLILISFKHRFCIFRKEINHFL